jgi:hypothetical protein
VALLDDVVDDEVVVDGVADEKVGVELSSSLPQAARNSVPAAPRARTVRRMVMVTPDVVVSSY